MTRLSLSSFRSSQVRRWLSLIGYDPRESVQVEPLTFSTIRVAERTCAGCNFCIAPADPRWISEGQHISNEAYSFHDNRCKERMLNREFAEYLGKEKLDLRQELRRAAGGPEGFTPRGS